MNPSKRRTSQLEAEAKAEIQVELEKTKAEEQKKAKESKSTKKLIKETKNMLLGITPASSQGKFSKKEFKSSFKQRKAESLKTETSTKTESQSEVVLNEQADEASTYEFQRAQMDILKLQSRKRAAYDILQKLELI